MLNYNNSGDPLTFTIGSKFQFVHDLPHNYKSIMSITWIFYMGFKIKYLVCNIKTISSDCVTLCKQCIFS